MKFKDYNLDKYDVIGFDIDGTLYPLEENYKVMLKTFIRHPFLSRCQKEFRKKERKEDSKIINYYEREAIFFKNYFKLDNLEKAKKLIKTLIDTQNKYYDKIIKPYPNVQETFKRLKEQGKKIYLLSDFPIANKPKVLGIDKYIDGAFYAADSNALKPDARAFDQFLSQDSCDKDKILYIGDRMPKDIVGANNVGIDSLLFSKVESPKVKSFSTYED